MTGLSTSDFVSIFRAFSHGLLLSAGSSTFVALNESNGLTTPK